MDEKEQVGNVPTPLTNTSADAPTEAPQNSEPKNDSEPATEQSDVSRDMAALLDEAASLSNVEQSEEEVPEVAPAPRKKNPKLIRAISYAVLGVLVLGLLAGLLYIVAQVLSARPLAEGDIYDSDMLFIRENKASGNYALFDLKKGKRITDFEFSEAGTFVNGYTYAKNDSGYMIYRADGKISVPAGKYEEVEQISSAFLVKLSGSSAYSLIDGSNHVLAEYNEMPEYRGLEVSDGRFFVYRDKKSQYRLVNAFGEEKASFMCDEDPEAVDYHEDSSYVSCGGKYYILDADELAVGASFELPDNATIRDYSDDAKLVLATKNQEKWFVVIDGVVRELDGVSSCMIRDEFGKSFIACRPKDDSRINEYLIVHKDGTLTEKPVKITDNISMSTSYDEDEIGAYSVIDGDTYAYVDEKGDAHFIAGGQEVKKLALSAKSQIYGIEGSGRYYVGLEYGESMIESAKLFDEKGEFVVDLAKHCGSISAAYSFGKDYIFCQGMTKDWASADNYASMLKSLKSVLLDKDLKPLITGKDSFAFVDNKQKIISVEGAWAMFADDDEETKVTYELHGLDGKILATLEGRCQAEVSKSDGETVYDKKLYFTCEEDDSELVKIMDVETGDITEYEGSLGDEHNEKYFTVESEHGVDYYLIDGTKLYSQPKEA